MAPSPPPLSSSRSTSRSHSSSPSSSPHRHASLATTTTTTTRITKRSSTPSPLLTRAKLTTPSKATPSTPSTAWSVPSDALLLRLRASNLSWNTIATNHFPHKTSNACRKRHERLVARQKDANWDERAQREWLAREYMVLRKEMWSLLAERMEPDESGVGGREAGWKVVERKCMEMGLRALTREARRGERSGLQGEDEGDGRDGDVEFGESDAEAEGQGQDSSEVVGSLHDSGIDLRDEEGDVRAQEIKTEHVTPELQAPVTPSRAYGYLRNQPHLIESAAASPNYVLEPVVKPTETPLRTPSRKVTIASLLRSPSPSPEPLPRVERWQVVGGGFVRA